MGKYAKKIFITIFSNYIGNSNIICIVWDKVND